MSELVGSCLVTQVCCCYSFCKCRVFKFCWYVVQVTSYFKYLCWVLFVFQHLIPQGRRYCDEIVLWLLYNFLLLLENLVSVHLHSRFLTLDDFFQ